MSTITLGKYTITVDESGAITTLRNGQPWLDYVGDFLTLALVRRIEELEAERAHIGELARATHKLYDIADNFSVSGVYLSEFPENRKALNAVDQELFFFDHHLEPKI